MDPAHGVFYLQPGWNGNYQITAGLRVGDKQESKGQKIREVVPETAPAGGGWERLPLPSWGFSSLGPAPPLPLLLIPLELCTGLNQFPTCPTAHRSQHLSSLLKTIFIGFVVSRQSSAETHTKLRDS